MTGTTTTQVSGAGARPGDPAAEPQRDQAASSSSSPAYARTFVRRRRHDRRDPEMARGPRRDA